MNFFDNNIPFSNNGQMVSNPMGSPMMQNDLFYRINEIENRIRKLELRIARLESDKSTGNNYVEPDNSLYMI